MAEHSGCCPDPTGTRPARDRLRSITEASGFLVGPAVFKTVEGATSSLAGSIPVRLRSIRGIPPPGNQVVA